METCADCGFVFTADLSTAPSDRTPCPQCRSTRRHHTLEAEPAHIQITGQPAELTFIDYPHVLLEEGRELIARGYFGLAVVVCHVACEIAVQRAMSRAFAKRSIEDLEQAIAGFTSGDNLVNDRLRKVYIALTGDNIKDQPFWTEFARSSSRRNETVHRGTRVPADAAEASLQATSAFIDHVGKQG